MSEKKEKKLTNPWADTEVDSVEETEEKSGDSNLFDVNFDQLVDQLNAEMPKDDTEDDLEEELEETKTEKSEEPEEVKTEKTEEPEEKTDEQKSEKTEELEEAKTEDVKTEEAEAKSEKTDEQNAQNGQNEQKEAKQDKQNAQNDQNEQKGSFEENTKGLTDSLSVDPANFFDGFDQVDNAQTSKTSHSKVFNPGEKHASKVFDPTGNASENHASKVFDPTGGAPTTRKAKVFDPSAKKETAKEKKETPSISGSKTTVLDFDPLAEVKEALGEDKFNVLKRQLNDSDVNAIVKTALDSYLAAVEEAKQKALQTFKSDASLGLVNAHLEILKKEQEEAEAWKAEMSK